MTIRILLADDHKILRDGLRSLIEQQQDLEVIAEAEDGRTAIRLAGKLSPDVVIIDIAMPGLNGIEATRMITSRKPSLRVIALSMHSDRRFVMGMFKAGASAYLLKDSAFEELIQAIHAVMAHGTYLSPRLANDVLKDYIRRFPDDTGSVHSVLSAREREVLQLLAEGKSTKQIAENLAVSIKTVETHRQQIMAKVGVRSVAELTKYAIREGLTSLENQ
jgi:DNA-binding NarL/FixJ family response regulator